MKVIVDVVKSCGCNKNFLLCKW